MWWFDPLFLRTTLIATWAFALLCDCSISWTFSTCFFKTSVSENFYQKSYSCVFWVTFLRTTLIATWGFCSFVWLFNLMNFSNMFFKMPFLEKLLSQILHFCDFLFSWPESTYFLGFHFCENFDSKLDTWMFLNSIIHCAAI